MRNDRWLILSPHFHEIVRVQDVHEQDHDSADDDESAQKGPPVLLCIIHEIIVRPYDHQWWCCVQISPSRIRQDMADQGEEGETNTGYKHGYQSCQSEANKRQL